MKDLKKFIISEIKNAINEERNRINKKRLDKALYETVNASSKLKKRIAESTNKKEINKLK